MSCQLCNPTGQGVVGPCNCSQLGSLSNQQFGIPIVAQQGINQQWALSQFPLSAAHVSDDVIDFLRLIEDKSDTQAVIAYMEKQLNAKKSHVETLERLEAKLKLFQEHEEKLFIDLCAKYRPSITPEFIERIKNLKAFI